LGEIEATLRQHPTVREAVVVAREDVPGDKRLVAYVVPPAEAALTSDALRGYLREWLPGYMVPAAFVPLERLPLTPNGKVDRRALPVPDWANLDHESSFVAPQTSVEEALARIWTQFLGVEQVSTDSNFFDLGGHSLLMTQVIAQVREIFRIELPITVLFDAPTIGSLANYIIDVIETKEQEEQLPAITPVSRDMLLPVTFAQEQVWFLNQLIPDNLAYNFQSTIRFKGLLDVAALNQALAGIVQRHEILRTSFQAVDGQPVQVIHTPFAVDMPVVDLRGIPQDQREAEAERLIFDKVRKPFDTTQLPLIRWTLLTLDEADHLLVQVEHHFVHDVWSLAILLREMFVLYEAFSERSPSPLPKLPIQFADFGVWQRQLMQGRVKEKQLAYWKEKLANPTTLELPTDRPRPRIQSLRGGSIRVELAATLYKALRALSRQEGVTLFMTLLAAFQILLCRYTGQDDILVGSGVANRRLREIEGLVGMIVNTVVLRTDFSGDPTFREALHRVRETALQAYAHQDLPFELLVRELQPERDLSRNPLFQVLFSFHDAPMPDMELPGLTASFLERSNGSAKFDLNIVVIPRAEQRVSRSPKAEDENLIMRWEYNSDLFDEATITHMIAHYQTLLEGIIADATQRIFTLPLLTDVELRQLLIDWNAPVDLFPLNRLTHRVFEGCVLEYPDAIAATHGAKSVTYADLNQRANQIAYWLHDSSSEPNIRVGVFGSRGIDMLVMLLAIAKADFTYVPLDPRQPDARLTTIIEDSCIQLIATQRSLVKRIHDLSLTNTASLRFFCWDDAPTDLDVPDRQVLASYPNDNLDSDAALHNLANIFYTSGSTGIPKGVMVEHVGMLNHLWAKIHLLGLNTSSIVAQNASHCFDISIWQFLAPLMVGGQIVIYDDDIALDPLALLQAVKRDRVTVLETVPSLLTAMLDAVVPTGYGRDVTILNDMRFLISNAEVLPVSLCNRWLEHFPHVPIVNTYGATECSDDTTHHVVTAPIAIGAACVPVGKPIPGFKIYILDDHLQPIPVGCTGQIAMAGIGVGPGYAGDAVKTARAFVPNLFGEPGSRLYLTRDLGRWTPDGVLEFVGRQDMQVKVRGYRVELLEIEAVLMWHPGVREAAVLIREDTPGDKRLIAYIVSANRNDPGMPGRGPESQWNIDRPMQWQAQVIDTLISQLRSYLTAHLPEYMIPAHIIGLDALPVTPNGKLDRHALPAPSSTLRAVNAAYVAPHTYIEGVVASIWAEVLGVEQVGIYDNFFELGGHSLLATQVISRLSSALKVDVPLRRLFEAPTVSNLAETIIQQEIAPLDETSLTQMMEDIDALSASEVHTMLAVRDQARTEGSQHE